MVRKRSVTMRKSIRINYADFWKGFDPLEHRIYRILSERYRVDISDQPDYLFYCDHGHRHLDYNGVRIYYTGENSVPDFNLCDYAVGPHLLQFGDRYLRIPLTGLRSEEYVPLAGNKIVTGGLANRKFCNFVYSNTGSADPFRLAFFHKLSQYKQVDSGGKLENNVGGAVQDKAAFQAQYKFSIAFENSSTDGYVTEKLTQPMLVNSIPIYWGNPHIAQDFNPASFVQVKDSSEASVKAAIEEIKFLDQNDGEYLRKLSEPWLKPGQYVDYMQRLAAFLYFIIDQPLESAGRRSRFGRVYNYEKGLQELVARAAIQSARKDAGTKNVLLMSAKRVVRRVRNRMDG